MGWQEVQYGALNLLEIVIKQENLLMLHKKLVPNSMNYYTNKNITLMIHYKQLEIRTVPPYATMSTSREACNAT